MPRTGCILKLRFVIGGLLLAAAAYFAFFGGEYSLFDLRRVRREQVVEQQRLDSIRAEVTRLEARRDSLMNDSATIERIARERYGMIRAGERLYRFAGPQDSAKADSARRANGSVKDSIPR
ncbi:MAG: septum formation initiator family protein [Longimicrobiales bacterium]